MTSRPMEYLQSGDNVTSGLIVRVGRAGSWVLGVLSLGALVLTILLVWGTVADPMALVDAAATVAGSR